MAKQGLTNKVGSGTAVNVVTTNETIGATVQVSTDNPGANVTLEGNVDLTTGTGVTGVTVQVRRGATVAGAVVGTAEVPAVGASTRVVFPIQVNDQPGEVASQSYILTVTQTGATGNGTINSASLQATY